MKKSFIFISCIILFFTGCSSKELENKIVELENKVTELQTKIIEEENQKLTFADECQKLENRILNLEQKIEVQNQINKVFIDYNDIFNQEKYEIHELQYSLDFKYDGFNIMVYKNLNTENKSYIIQKDDVVDVSLFIYEKESQKSFIKVCVNNQIDGYIKIDCNPYSNGNFEFIETIDVDGKQISVLQLTSTFLIREGTIINALPSENSRNLHEISHKEGGEYYQALAITSDYQWVKVSVEEITGWVPAKTLSRDIGGPTIYTPEKRIYWELIDSNMI